MNARQLQKLGVPTDCVKDAVLAIASASAAGVLRDMNVKNEIGRILACPSAHFEDPHFGPFARAVAASDGPAEIREPIRYRTWGDSGIDVASHVQMRQACALPMAAGAALMADAHVGYGLPIGGVLALEGAVCPYAVGVDIACRMKLSVLDAPAESLAQRSKFDLFRDALERGTCFGVGEGHERRQSHAVMDQDWNVAKVTRENKDKAWKQLGSSGSGNHFVEFGLLTLDAHRAGTGSGERTVCGTA